MSNKKNSTIGTKPAVQPDIETWIGNNANATENPPAAPDSGNIAEQQTNKSDDQQVSKSASSEATTMFSARIPAKLMRKLRIHAATEERQIQEIITEILRNYLGDE